MLNREGTNHLDKYHEYKRRNKDFVIFPLCFLWSRAKEIKSKLGVLLQKPENAIDLIIPYPEKTEKKPEKLQK